jgi:hypothetical protein
MAANRSASAGSANLVRRSIRHLLLPQHRGVVLTVAVVVAALGGALYGWQRWGALAAHEYLLTPERIQITPPPAWIRSDVKAAVVRTANLTRLDVRDRQLAPQLAAAFALHPWVAKVVRVQKRFPPSAEVVLDYRRPVAAVRVEPHGKSELLFVDEQGVLLPTEDFLAVQGPDFLRIEAGGDLPTSGYGLPWKSARIIGAARLAAAWNDRWRPLGLYQIVATETAAGPLTFELRTPKGTRIVWGAAPGQESSREPTAEQKISALEEYVRDKGPLDRDGGESTLDLRELFRSALERGSHHAKGLRSAQSGA